MTDEQIIKAFKCITYGEIDKCLRCPYDVYKECETFVYEDALELIKRQRAEIERLKVEKDNLIKTYAECQVEFLKEYVEKLNSGFIQDHIYRGGYVLGLANAIAKGMAGDSDA